MQSTPPSSAGSSSSPSRSDFASKRRSVVALRSPSGPSSSPLRVVHAEGNDFVIEPLPSRLGPSASRLPSTTRHVSAPHSSTASTSSSPLDTASYSSSQPRAVPSSITPPRTRQADRPYRPPPSSSARFYERQQQVWLLQQPSLLPPTPAAYVPSSSLHSPIAHNTAPASALPPLQPTSPPYSYAPGRERVSLSIRCRSSSIASGSSRSRAASVSSSISSLAPPEASRYKNRARSGSDASSFTRSCISNGYLSHTDDDSVDHHPSQPPSPIAPGHASLQSSTQDATYPNPTHRPAVAPGPQGSSPLQQSVIAPLKSPARDSLGGSIDADWDAELGISEIDHIEPLRLPMLQQTDQVLHPSPTIVDASSVAKPDLFSTKVVVSGASSVSTPVSANSHLHSIQAADLRGIRVTSSVSESWDDDFLFQNEEDAAASTSPSNGRTPRSVPGGQSGSNEQKRNSLHGGEGDDDEDDDVENWDDAFSWNADAQMTPSASNTSSLHNSMRVSNIPLAGSHGHALHGSASSSRELPADVRRHLDFGGGADGLSFKKRLSNSSTASGATDFSARLAAQYEANSDRQRLSFDSDGFSAPGLLPSAGHRNALGLAGASRKSRPSTGGGQSEADGDDTETETPSKDADARLKSRPTRRSLGAALGFDTSRRSTLGESATSSTSRNDEKKKDESATSADKSHKRSKSRLGALQRLSFSRSRVNVANASSTSINEMPNSHESPQVDPSIYANGANKSQVSLLSQMSNSSNRSRRGASPSSLEKSYAALRSTSFRRLLGRGGQSNTTSPSALATPPSSPPRRTSELAQPLDAFCSPTGEAPPFQPPTQSMSPPSAWLGFRRSSEATPTRSKELGNRRGSDYAHRDSSEQESWAVPISPNRPPVSPEGRGQRDVRTMPSVQARLQNSDPSEDVSRWKDVSSPARGLGYPVTANLRRDFSSSNTLRAAMTFGEEDSNMPTHSRHDASRTETSTPTLQPSYREIHSRNASDEATADGPTSAQHPYLGQRMLRGSDDNTYASRSVSASTAHSQTSTDSLSGYRMRKQISASSGQDAHDSETSYGTSVGSSPGLSNPSSSGWLSHGKRGATSSFDTKDTAWSSTVASSAHHGSLRVHSDQHSRAASMPGSPINLEKTLEGTPATAPRTTRMLSAPDTSLSPPRQLQQGDVSYTGSPMTPSRGVRLQAIDSSPIKPPNSAADTSAPVLSSASIAASSTASPQKSATRRNSLSDLKIPTRISKAQTGLRNNISLVRDFAKGIEELKMLKASYLDHKMRAPLSSSEVEERAQNWLECADVLIGLGEGRSEADSAARVDTVSHTPLAVRVDSRRTTFSDVSSYAAPRSPLDGPASRQSSISGARSTSGTSQATTSTTDGVRSVDVQREIDILSAILGPTSRVESRSHGRFQSETYSRDEALHRRNAELLTAPHRAAVAGSSADTDIQWSNLTTPNRVNFDAEKRSAKSSRSKQNDRAFNTAPVSGGLTEVPSLEGVDVGDANRSAKRRLRSASRAGLHGLRELLKGFKGAETASTTAVTKATDSGPRREEEPRTSVDVSSPSTPAKQQKRKSLNLKRRSFLRSKASLDDLQAKGTDAPQEVTPPMPSAPFAAVGKKQASPGRISLDTTWEAETMADSKQRAKEARAGRRISLQSALSGKRRSVDGGNSTQVGQRAGQSIDIRMKVDAERHNRRPSLAPLPPSQLPSPQTGAGEDSRRASTSVDTMYQRPTQPGSSQSSLEAANLQTPGTVQKLALRPEAMPGLLVYVQATRQHLIAAIEELGPHSAV